MASADRPRLTQRYWNTTLESTWEVGSTITWNNHGVIIADPDQVVLEYDPYRRLASTWHTFTPELAEVHGFGDVLAKLAGEHRSRVAFELEPVDAMVKLTVVHDDFEADSTAAGMVSEGWHRVLSDLKTMLETHDRSTRSAAPLPAGQDRTGRDSRQALAKIPPRRVQGDTIPRPRALGSGSRGGWVRPDHRRRGEAEPEYSAHQRGSGGVPDIERLANGTHC